MPFVLLRPHILSIKNSLRSAAQTGAFWRKHLPFTIMGGVVMYFIFASLYASLQSLAHSGELSSEVISTLIEFAVMAFFLLLVLSNIITSIGWFYCAKDLPLLLTLPISSTRFYFSRLVVTCSNASWLLVLFLLPLILASYRALNLPPSFLLASALVGIPLLVIPAGIGSSMVTIMLTVIPLRKFHSFILIIPLILLVGIMFMEKELTFNLNIEEHQMANPLTLLAKLKNPNPAWLPSRWASELINGSLHNDYSDRRFYLNSTLLLLAAIISVLLGYALFRYLFLRSLTESLKEGLTIRTYTWPITRASSRIIFPFEPQMRGFLIKECRMFLRDPTQCVQLCLLLLLSVVYLYNIKTLRSVSLENDQAFSWWQAMLCISNIALGASVISAICTRFVFPSISLEGQAYWIVRSAPVTLRQLILSKFKIWLIPIALISVVLLVSGAFAAQVPALTIGVCAMLALCLSIGLVGLTAGLGGVYATFDWDSPTQAAANFGSIIVMLLAVALILVTLIPASLVIVVTSVPQLTLGMTRSNYLISIGCAMFLAFIINLITARWAINVGELALRRREA